MNARLKMKNLLLLAFLVATMGCSFGEVSFSPTATKVLPTEIVTMLPTETATVMPTEIVTMLPTETVTVMPTEIVTMLPTETATVLPTETAVPLVPLRELTGPKVTNFRYYIKSEESIDLFLDYGAFLLVLYPKESLIRVYDLAGVEKYLIRIVNHEIFTISVNTFEEGINLKKRPSGELLISDMNTFYPGLKTFLIDFSKGFIPITSSNPNLGGTSYETPTALMFEVKTTEDTISMFEFHYNKCSHLPILFGEGDPYPSYSITIDGVLRYFSWDSCMIFLEDRLIKID